MPGPKRLRPVLKRTAAVIVMLRPGERQAVEEVAALDGTTLSTLGRAAMLREVRRLRRQQQVGTTP